MERNIIYMTVLNDRWAKLNPDPEFRNEAVAAMEKIVANRESSD